MKSTDTKNTSIIDQKYTGLCTVLGDLTTKRTELDEQIAEVVRTMGGLRAISAEMRQLEIAMAAKVAESAKTEKTSPQN